ncbi:hypothetical protein [Thiocapsa sp.]|uniref:hypothetical protein n=1 Tax=Thiocapsa sp. TaxID=2024551 RepID=UPI003593F8CD
MPNLTLAIPDSALFAPACSPAELDLSPLTEGESCDAIREHDPGMDQADSDICLRGNDASRLHGSAAP